MDHATALDLFKFYSNEMKDLYAAYTGMILTISASLLGIIGWFLTSDKPHRIVAKLKYARNIFLGCLLITAVVEGRIILMLMSTGRKIQTAISTIAPQIEGKLNISFYTYRKMTMEIACWYYGFHLVLFGVLVYLICRSKKSVAVVAPELIKKRTSKS